MNVLRMWRGLFGRETGRTFICGKRTNLTIEDQGWPAPLCQLCTSPKLLRRTTVGDGNKLLKCDGVRIMGIDGRSFPSGVMSVDVKGIHQNLNQIKTQCLKLGERAQLFLNAERWAVGLVTYSDERYTVYGVGFGDSFPVGSKIKLADLPFEVVDDRFEPKRPKLDIVQEFDDHLQNQVKAATKHFSTDSYDEPTII